MAVLLLRTRGADPFYAFSYGPPSYLIILSRQSPSLILHQPHPVPSQFSRRTQGGLWDLRREVWSVWICSRSRRCSIAFIHDQHQIKSCPFFKSQIMNTVTQVTKCNSSSHSSWGVTCSSSSHHPSHAALPLSSTTSQLGHLYGVRLKAPTNRGPQT